MSKTTKFGARSTADQVLAGIDLTGKHMLVTECDSDVGFATASALAANGAHVIVAARAALDAVMACEEIGYRCTPLECDLGDLNSIRAATRAVLRMHISLDAIVANSALEGPDAGNATHPAEQTRVPKHLGRFALLTRLLGLLSDGSARIVLAASGAGAEPVEDATSPRDQHAWVSQMDPDTANALYAEELTKQMHARGVTVNTAEPESVFGSNRPVLRRRPSKGIFRRALDLASRAWSRNPAREAATLVLLTAGLIAPDLTRRRICN